METDLNSQDRKDLDKFIKFFALKTVQVIVQARLGEKICTRSSSSPTGSDWFNLAIKDIPEVTHEAKKALAGQLPAVGRSMCVEISLKTSEGDSMELEIWCLEMNEKCDKEIKVSYTVYNRLSLLLKSLLAITRVTPAYRLSRKQGHEYVILYRIYFGEVQLNGLGEGFQTVRVGTVGTPVGTITLSCAYRINLAFMSTRQFERTPPIMGIIIDHFVDRPYPSSSPMHPCNYRTAGEDTGVTYPSVEDSQEVCTTSFSTSPPSQCVFTVTKAHFQTPTPVVTDTLRVPMAGLAFSHQLSSSRLSYQPAALGVGSADLAYPVVFAAGLNTTHPHQLMVPGKEGGVPLAPNQPAHGAQADQERLATYTPSDGAHCAVTPSSSEDTETVSNSSEGRASPHDVLETIFVRKVGAFVNKPINQVTLTSLDIPFAMFAPKNLELEDADPMVNPPDSPETESPLQGSLHSDGSSGGSSGNTHDDFVMIDFKPAFSKDDILPMDLGTFYREFQNPPQLSSLSIDIGAQSMAEDLDSLPEKLAVHEKNVREFDAFVETLQ
ncbi:autophagy-related protein 13 isoform X5 [Vulpes vulpes]|uniref:Autophagy-related protein 13 n=3 Tax=Canidae TaxID=9608 RepID=A0A8C0YX87_CANLF|nr:autophagy-related protein 13 isoform X1 [Canis lupus familiaris]XP_005631337.1 autophagy-related protein 13 isoform X1 [Canis lupus familiaris]XP_013976591.1 autophagy-related protein 13 isoform X1 [Canis lupus familiaris]XP_013976592.1 autophagy-related protein 13 isoform X1 [Canis lupus familiaris]XP_022261186.1 autophagy-related protein 13 isoform X1 [Canis lupus familiaris]XP_022261187.1 autophagy-related protein 13 isoform X1 [Canis lupus familiaris]XP_022261188.1 autophagy-related pr|eukprot:XP_005631334.1 autophagy-related protein 13 isoform X1 [Canis lupus familiaris]